MPSEKINSLGGDLELDMALLLKSERHSSQDYFRLDKAKDHAWVSLGRDALKLALMTEGLREGEEVLIPSFLCPKVIDVLEELKLTYRLFNISEAFKIDSGHLLDCLSSKTKAVIFINYFGYSLPDFHLMETLKGRNKNIAVILDYAQAHFSIAPDILESRFVDYIVTSLRKFMPLPDGALLIANRKPIDKRPILREPRKAVFKRGLGKVIKHAALEAVPSNPDVEKLHLDLIYSSEEDFNSEQGIHPISDFSCHLLKRIDWETVAERRRSNARYLYAHLDASLLPRWDGESVLLAIPIFLKNRDRVRSALMAHRIYLPVHWPLDERIDRGRYAAAHRLASEELSLVIDQRYDSEDMDYLAETLKKVLSEN